MTSTHEKSKILAFGGLLADIILPVSDEEFSALSLGISKGDTLKITPEKLQELLHVFSGRKPLIMPGGSAANTLRVIASKGLDTAILGVVGNDEYGVFLREQLRLAHVGTDYIHTLPGCRTDCCLVLVTPDGERTMFPMIDVGAHAESLQADASAFVNARHLHLEGYCVRTPTALYHTVAAASGAGLSLSMDLGSTALIQQYRAVYNALRREFRLDWLFGNASEAGCMTGETSPERAAARLRSLGFCRNAVVTCGAEGAVLALGNGTIRRIPAAPLPGKLVDTVGAGDTFTGSFLAGIHSGIKPSDAAVEAAIAAAAVVCHAGANLS